MLLSNHTLEAMTSSDGCRRKALASLGAILGMAVSVGHQALGVTAVSARRSSSSSSSSSSGGRAPQGKIRAAWAGSSRADAAFPLLHLHFCLGCSDPASEGSLGKKNGLRGYFDAPRTHVDYGRVYGLHRTDLVPRIHKHTSRCVPSALVDGRHRNTTWCFVFQVMLACATYSSRNSLCAGCCPHKSNVFSRAMQCTAASEAFLTAPSAAFSAFLIHCIILPLVQALAPHHGIRDFKVSGGEILDILRRISCVCVNPCGSLFGCTLDQRSSSERKWALRALELSSPFLVSSL